MNVYKDHVQNQCDKSVHSSTGRAMYSRRESSRFESLGSYIVNQ